MTYIYILYSFNVKRIVGYLAGEGGGECTEAELSLTYFLGVEFYTLGILGGQEIGHVFFRSRRKRVFFWSHLRAEGRMKRH